MCSAAVLPAPLVRVRVRERGRTSSVSVHQQLFRERFYGIFRHDTTASNDGGGRALCDKGKVQEGTAMVG